MACVGGVCAPVRVMRFSNIRITFVVDQLVRDHVKGAAQVTGLFQIQRQDLGGYAQLEIRSRLVFLF